MNINITLKTKFIKHYNTIACEENYNDYNTLYTTYDILNDIFYICIKKYDLNFDNIMFKTITQDNILKIIENNISSLFKCYCDIFNNDHYEYKEVAILFSGLQFLIDYTESHEDTKCCMKKRLQNIIECNKSTYVELKKAKNKCKTDYLGRYDINLIYIPESHIWWQRVVEKDKKPFRML